MYPTEGYLAVVAQLAEQRTCNARVTGSNPVDGSQEGNLFQVSKRLRSYHDCT